MQDFGVKRPREFTASNLQLRIRMILKLVLKKQDDVMWAGLMLLRIGLGVNTALHLHFQQCGQFN